MLPAQLPVRSFYGAMGSCENRRRYSDEGRHVDLVGGGFGKEQLQ